MSKGIQVLKSFVEVQDIFQADPEDLYVDSDTPLLKIAFHESGSVSFATGENGVSKDVDFVHALGYRPHWAIFAEAVPGSNDFRLVSSSTLGLTGDGVLMTNGISESLLRIRFTGHPSNDPAGTYRYTFLIFHDEVE